MEENIETRFKAIEEDIKELFGLSKVSECFQSKTEVTLQYIKNSIDDLTKEIKKISELPSKRWDKLTSGLTLSIATMVVGYILGKVLH